MRTHPGKHDTRSADRSLHRSGFAGLLGLVLLLVAFLMLTFTPQLVYRTWHRDGYERTEAEVLSGRGRAKSFRVRVVADDQVLLVRSASFNGYVQHQRIPVWYNPAAHVEFGIRLFDERVISAERSPELPDFTGALAAVLVNLLFACGGAYLLRDVSSLSDSKQERTRAKKSDG
jgi:hypothetical protein